MTELTPDAVESEIRRLVGALERKTTDFVQAAREASDAEVAYKMGHAREKLKITTKAAHSGERKTVGQIDAEADVATSDLFAAYKSKESTVDALKQSLISIRTALDSYRTLAANVRSFV